MLLAMNIVLVYRGRYHVRQALDLETLAAVVRQAGHDVRLVYDSDAYNDDLPYWLAGKDGPI